MKRIASKLLLTTLIIGQPFQIAAVGNNQNNKTNSNKKKLDSKKTMSVINYTLKLINASKSQVKKGNQLTNNQLTNVLNVYDERARVQARVQSEMANRSQKIIKNTHVVSFILGLISGLPSILRGGSYILRSRTNRSTGLIFSYYSILLSCYQLPKIKSLYNTMTLSHCHWPKNAVKFENIVLYLLGNIAQHYLGKKKVAGFYNILRYQNWDNLRFVKIVPVLLFVFANAFAYLSTKIDTLQQSNANNINLNTIDFLTYPTEYLDTLKKIAKTYPKKLITHHRDENGNWIQPLALIFSKNPQILLKLLEAMGHNAVYLQHTGMPTLFNTVIEAKDKDTLKQIEDLVLEHIKKDPKNAHAFALSIIKTLEHTRFTFAHATETIKMLESLLQTFAKTNVNLSRIKGESPLSKLLTLQNNLLTQPRPLIVKRNLKYLKDYPHSVVETLTHSLVESGAPINNSIIDDVKDTKIKKYLRMVRCYNKLAFQVSFAKNKQIKQESLYNLKELISLDLKNENELKKLLFQYAAYRGHIKTIKILQKHYSSQTNKFSLEAAIRLAVQRRLQSVLRKYLYQLEREEIDKFKTSLSREEQRFVNKTLKGMIVSQSKREKLEKIIQTEGTKNVTLSAEKLHELTDLMHNFYTQDNQIEPAD